MQSVCAWKRCGPAASAALILVVGIYTGWLGWHGLTREPATLAAISGPMLPHHP